ncbi:hypothetical protein [Sphingomonas sp. Root710]|uniref:hypothetical protein n=1 Tax=Sphingomonas sp. Root710 TaxID=1736594 RepID=UPI000A6A734F|nr:hypothetical protein [Sphingomonas sp. Root710]
MPRASKRSARRLAAQDQQDLNGNPAVRGTDGARGSAIFRAASAATKAVKWLLARYAQAQEARIAGRLAA